MKSMRALLGMLLVVIAAVGATLYISYERGLADTGNLQIFLGGEKSGTQLVDLAYQQLQREYYKPFDPQIVVNGERKELLAYLKQAHVKNPQLPSTPATTTDNTAAIEAPLAYAQSHYGNSLGKDGSTNLTEAALRGEMSSLGDPYTVYLSPKEIQGLNEQLQGGNFGGVGVYIDQLKDGRIFLQPIEGQPAARAGMGAVEFLTSVNGTAVKGMVLDHVMQMIRGPAGTIVRLNTYPYKDPKIHHRYTITRQIVHVPTVFAKMIDGNEYIRLSTFGESSADEVKAALLSGRAHNAKGYILDLRYDGGGLLDAAVKISSYFIPQGTIVATIDRNGQRTDADALGTAIPGLKPMVVLVNKFTASASEITSGALQDYGMATIIGTKTFGKGVVQSIYPMPDQGALKITTARYVTPLGRDIQHRGITPDILVNQDVNNPTLLGTSKDKQLAAGEKRLAELRHVAQIHQ